MTSHDKMNQALLKSPKIGYDERGKRGYYICDDSGTFYLHHDMMVYCGCCAGNGEAFWLTAEEANIALRKWKENVICE